MHQMRKELGWSVLGASLAEHVIRAGASSGQSQGWNFLLFTAVAVVVYFGLKPRILKAVPESFVWRRRGPWHWMFWPVALCLIVLLQLRFIGPSASQPEAGAEGISRLEASADQLQVPQNEITNPSAFFTKELDGISISLPKNWRWIGRADSESLNTNSEAMGDTIGVAINQGNNTILAAGNAFDDTKVSVATIRLSVRSASTISQTDLRQVLSEPKAEIESEIVGQSEQTATAMRRLPQVLYYNVAGGGLKQNGSLICSWSGFEYDIGKGPTVSDSWVCPLGDRTLKLTTSYAKSRANLYAATVDHVWRSLRLQ